MAPDVQVLPATRAHAEALAPLMRAEDAAEVLASAGHTPLQALLDALDDSAEAWAVLFDGEVAALFGVCPAPVVSTSILGTPLVGVPWALTGRAVDSHPRTFWRLSRPWLAHFARRYPVLVQAVDARYAASLRWLARLGFDVQPAAPHGAAGLPFHPVYYRSPHV